MKTLIIIPHGKTADRNKNALSHQGKLQMKSMGIKIFGGVKDGETVRMLTGTMNHIIDSAMHFRGNSGFNSVPDTQLSSQGVATTNTEELLELIGEHESNDVLILITTVAVANTLPFTYLEQEHGAKVAPPPIECGQAIVIHAKIGDFQIVTVE